jgi:hypothetical protein
MKNVQSFSNPATENLLKEEIAANPSIVEALRGICRWPGKNLLRLWNWKSVLLSSVVRALIFFTANLASGYVAALAAMMHEFVIRAAFAGFYGGLIESFRSARPRWAASLIVLFGLPLLNHAAEFLIHWLSGTPNWKAGILASILFTVLSTSFNLFAMRRNFFIAGSGGKSLWVDLKMTPRLVLAYAAAVFQLPRIALARLRSFEQCGRLRIPGIISAAVRTLRA